MKKAMAVMAILIWYVWGVPHAHAEPRFTFSHEWSFSFPQYENKDEGRTGVLIGLYNDSSMYYFNLGFNLTRPLEEDGTWAYACSGDVYNYRDNIACFMDQYPKHPGWWVCK